MVQEARRGRDGLLSIGINVIVVVVVIRWAGRLVVDVWLHIEDVEV